MSAGAESPNDRAKRLLGGFVVAHMAAYPVTFVWAAGAVVPVLARVPAATLANASREAVVRDVLAALVAPSLAIFVLLHVAAVPWMRDRAGARGKKLTLAVLGVALVLGAVFALATWGWLFTR